MLKFHSFVRAGSAGRHWSLLRAASGALAVLLVFAQASAVHAAGPAGIPRLASGKPDFSGIWQTTSAADFDLEPHSARKDAPPGAGIVEGNQIPYLPAALEQKKKNYEQRATADPETKCYLPGVPRITYMPYPFQIIQKPTEVTVL